MDRQTNTRKTRWPSVIEKKSVKSCDNVSNNIFSVQTWIIYLIVSIQIPCLTLNHSTYKSFPSNIERDTPSTYGHEVTIYSKGQSSRLLKGERWIYRITLKNADMSHLWSSILFPCSWTNISNRSLVCK